MDRRKRNEQITHVNKRKTTQPWETHISSLLSNLSVLGQELQEHPLLIALTALCCMSIRM